MRTRKRGTKGKNPSLGPVLASGKGGKGLPQKGGGWIEECVAAGPDTHHGMKHTRVVSLGPLLAPASPGAELLSTLGRGLERQPQGVLGALFCADLPVAIHSLCCGQGFPTVTPRTSGQDRSPLQGCPIHCKTGSSTPGPNPLTASSDPTTTTQ